jgi:hypothetical protein
VSAEESHSKAENLSGGTAVLPVKEIYHKMEDRFSKICRAIEKERLNHASARFLLRIYLYKPFHIINIRTRYPFGSIFCLFVGRQYADFGSKYRGSPLPAFLERKGLILKICRGFCLAQLMA